MTTRKSTKKESSVMDIADLLFNIGCGTTTPMRMSFITPQELQRIKIPNMQALVSASPSPISGQVIASKDHLSLDYLLGKYQDKSFPKFKELSFKNYVDFAASEKGKSLEDSYPYAYYHSLDIPSSLEQEISPLLNREVQKILQYKQQIIPASGFFSPNIYFCPGNSKLAGYSKQLKGTHGSLHLENGLTGSANMCLSGMQMWVIIQEASYDAFVTYLQQKHPFLSPFTTGLHILTLPEMRQHKITYEIIFQKPGAVVVTRSREPHYVVALSNDVMNVAMSYEDGYLPWSELATPLNVTHQCNYARVLDLMIEDYTNQIPHIAHGVSIAIPVAYLAWRVWQDSKVDTFAFVLEKIGPFIAKYYWREMKLYFICLTENIPLQPCSLPYAVTKCTLNKPSCYLVPNFVYTESKSAVACASCFLEVREDSPEDCSNFAAYFTIPKVEYVALGRTVQRYRDMYKEDKQHSKRRKVDAQEVEDAATVEEVEDKLQSTKKMVKEMSKFQEEDEL